MEQKQGESRRDFAIKRFCGVRCGGSARGAAVLGADVDGRWMTASQIARAFNIAETTVRTRIRRGNDPVKGSAPVRPVTGDLREGQPFLGG